EFITEFAFPLPITVICELLGVPTQDQALFRSHAPGVTLLLEFNQSPEDTEAGLMAAAALSSYLQSIFEDRRRAPRDDLISLLVHAEEDGDRLSAPELLVTTILLLAAGHETTMNLLGSAALALCNHPDQ